ncbi:MAG: hypothetical protein HY735_01640 [Verrucomicrobia bacterium]|nr:hypothetical protein [Verrucomicrobiota bacterium]
MLLGLVVFAIFTAPLPAKPDSIDPNQPAPAAEAEEIVFAVRQLGKDPHYYANFGYFAFAPERKAYGRGGKLCRLNLRTGRVTVLVDDPDGSVRDPQVHYAGQRILFSYRKGGTSNFNLYEIQADGAGLRQITAGPWDDIEPTYLPDGGILFCSSRCRRWVNCWPTEVAVLHRCDGDGGKLRALSSNNQHDNTPWVLPDGRVLYTRWEYVDRSEVAYHHLWTANPDGTAQAVFFGNMHPGTAMLDAKPIPGTQKIVASFSPGHGRREHDGYVTVVDPSRGPDAEACARRVSAQPDFRDPYPLSGDRFLAARRSSILLLDGQGATQALYTLPKGDQDAGLECHEPRPLLARSREAIVPPRGDLKQTTGTLILADAYHGRNMDGVKRGEIRELLVLETLPKPINFTGSGDPISYNGTFTLERVMGTVPVEADGSAYFELPALRSFFFVALDGAGLAAKRMQSFLTLQPGETMSCVGCHEHRTETPNVGQASNLTIQGASLFRPSGGKMLPELAAKVSAPQTPGLLALRRPPASVRPIPGIPEVFDFPRDIQPVLDRHCVRCHDYERREGSVILSGDRGPFFAHSFWMLTVRGQISDGRNLPRSNYPPRALGSAASPLMKLIDGNHYEAKLTPHERTMIRLWIETGAPYAGTYAALGTGMIGAYREDVLDRSDTAWPAVKAAASALARRCGACHTGALRLPSSPSDDLGMPPWESRFTDPRIRFSRHLLYNLTRPEKSLLLLGPLTKKAGGYGICREKGNETPGVFADTEDPDYRTLLASVCETKSALDRMKRFDMPGFRPGPEYIREMKRYGILPRALEPDAVIDTYAADRAYWQSLWYVPVGRTEIERGGGAIQAPWDIQRRSWDGLHAEGLSSRL